MHGRGDMDLTTSTYLLNSGRRTCVSLLDSVVFVTRSVDKWGLERRRMLEEERARKEAREEERVQM